MMIQMRSFVVESGREDGLVECFSSQGLVDKMKGFIDRTVMINRRLKGQEEVVPYKCMMLKLTYLDNIQKNNPWDKYI